MGEFLPQLGLGQARKMAAAAMAAASAELNAHRVNILVPPQSYQWLQVGVDRPFPCFVELLCQLVTDHNYTVHPHMSVTYIISLR